METLRDSGWLQNETGAGDAKDAMGIDRLPFRGAGQRWSGIVMTAKFEADPISAAGRIGGKPRPGHREDEAMQEQGMNQEACGQPPPPMPPLSVPVHANPRVRIAY
jgi:hypothetical protein